MNLQIEGFNIRKLKLILIFHQPNRSSDRFVLATGV